MIPVTNRFGIELPAEVAFVGGDVGLVLGLAEETVERLVVGQVTGRRQLQAGQSDVAAVEVDSNDLARIGRKVGEDVAATRGDRDQPCAGLQRERTQVDDGIFPDLRIDQAAKGEGEDALENTLP